MLNLSFYPERPEVLAQKEGCLTEAEKLVFCSIENILYKRFRSCNQFEDYEVILKMQSMGHFSAIVIIIKNRGALLINIVDAKVQNGQNPNYKIWNLSEPYKGQLEIKSPKQQIVDYRTSMHNTYSVKLSKAFRDIGYTLYKSIRTAVVFTNIDELQFEELNGSLSKINKKYEEQFTKFFLVKDINAPITSSYSNKFKYFICEELRTQPAIDEYSICEEVKQICEQKISTKETSLKYQNFKFNPSQAKILINQYPGQYKVKGIAGSGKTTVLAKKAILAADETKKPVLILTYNITLVNYIRYLIGQMGNSNYDNGLIKVMYYSYFISEYTNNLGLVTKKKEKMSPLEFFKSVAALEDSKTYLIYKTILVDEVQDFKKEWIKNIHNILPVGGELVFFGDEKQNIYKTQTLDDKTIYTGIEGKWKILENRNYRSANKLTILANRFQKEFLLNYKYEPISNIKNLKKDNSNIRYYYIENTFDPEVCFDYIEKFVQDKGIQINDITIFSHTGYPLKSLEKYARVNLKSKYNFMRMLETQEEYEKLCEKYPKDNNNKRPEKFKIELQSIRRPLKLSFNGYADAIKLSTIASFKGWESSTAVLIFIHSDLTSKSSDNKFYMTHESVYTALTRAKQNLLIINFNCARYDVFFKNNIEDKKEIKEHSLADGCRIIMAGSQDF